MTINSPICDILGIQYPIFQGAMAWIAKAPLAAAVSESGGLGIIAASQAPVAYVKEQIDEIRGLTKKPFAVNLMMQSPYIKDVIDLVIEEKVPVVTTGAGNPAPRCFTNFARQLHWHRGPPAGGLCRTGRTAPPR